MLECPYCGAETDFLTTEQVGRLLGVSAARARQMATDGRFPGAVRVLGIHKHGMWRIPATAVLPLVRRQSDT